MADWKTFQLQVPGKDALEPIREILEKLLIFLEVLKAILTTIQMFLVDFGNPLKALIEALIKLIEELFEALKKSGFFMYLDVPVSTEDPGFDKMRGGFVSFMTRFKNSLFDPKDFNRPQPRGSNKGGFVLMVLEADDPWNLILAIIKFLAFFGKGFSVPRFQAPENFKAIPVGDSGDPILAVASYFTEGPIESIQLQWTLPSTQESADPGLGDAIMKVWGEFVPPSFLIEKSTVNPMANRISAESDLNGSGAGLVEYDRVTTFEVNGEGTKFVKKEDLKDDAGEQVLKYEEYIKVGQTTQLMGALGKFRYIDNDVVADQDYYYRVRAYTGDLKIDESAKKLDWSGSLAKLDTTKHKRDFANNSKVATIKWPAQDENSPVVMGAPTGQVKARIPVDLGDFDLIAVLRALFKTAFSLDFHQQPRTGEVDGKVVQLAEFNSDGTPKTGSFARDIGRGLLVNNAGILAGLNWIPLIGMLTELESVGELHKPDETTGVIPPAPWTNFNVIRMSARLADATASAMLDIGSSVLYAFRDLMRSLPNGTIPFEPLQSLTTLEEVVFQLTATEDYIAREGEQAVIRGVLDAVKAYLLGYDNAELRLNVQTAIIFIKNFTLGGVPPDWISVVPLRDIIPWAGEVLYDILELIRALLDAFQGILDEINNFIEALIRKIEALEAFIQFLIDMLNFIESLQIAFFLLSIPDIDGPITEWVREIDLAGGDKPISGQSGYSAGICLAYVAPNIDAFITAFEIIFGA